MQYGGYDVYKIYLGVKLHFTTSSYDYIKYNGKNNATLESFTKRKDRYFFHKLSKRYNERDILDYFVSNFAIDGRKWIGNLIRNDGNEAYINYKKYKETFDYSLREDLGRMLSDFEFKSAFLLMMAWAYVMDNIHDSYVYLFKGKLVSKPPYFLTSLLRFVKIMTKKYLKQWFGLKFQKQWSN